MKEVRKIPFQMMAVIAVSAGVALLVNAARKDRLPLVMPFPPEYRCPSGVDAAPPVALAKALAAFGRSDTVVVDARNEEEFEKGHIEGALNIPYLSAEPTSNEVLLRLRPYKTIIVYCNTMDAQLSKLLSAEFAQAGVGGARYLVGGFLGWVTAGGKFTGEKPQMHEELR